MPMIQQPLTQKKLTNVAAVKLKAAGVNFEIAAYKNKVVDWREGIEKDLNEVLQIITVYTNVEKGDLAKNADLKKAFGTCDKVEVCKKILKTGQLQVSDLERELKLKSLFNDIVQLIVERCVHTQTGRQLTAMTVESALREQGISVVPDHTAKKQALVAIKTLCTSLPESFTRAKMRLAISCPVSLKEEIKEFVVKHADARIEEERSAADGESCSFTFSCPPHHYRELDRLATVTHVGQNVTLHVVTTTVLGEAAIEKPQGEEATDAAAPATQAPGPVDTDENCQPLWWAREREASGGYPQKQEAAAKESAAAKVAPRKPGMRCSACNGEFENAADYRQHCRDPWHLYNLKRKVKALPPVTAEEYAEVALDMREGFLAVDP